MGNHAMEVQDLNLVQVEERPVDFIAVMVHLDCMFQWLITCAAQILGLFHRVVVELPGYKHGGEKALGKPLM